jgi:hypothetical protein
MGNFDSPLGKKSFSGQSLREYDVPDGADEQYEELPQQVMRTPRKIQFAGKIEPLDQDAISQFQESVAQRDGSQVEREIRAAKEARRNGIERISEGAKRRIEMLIGLTRTTRDVDIEGNIFTLQSLKSKEMRQAIMTVAKYDGTIEGPFEMRKQYLARSITHVAGVEIDQFLASNTIEAKLAFIDELDEPLLNHLYNEYLELLKVAKEKYSINTVDEVKEVLEDLKK